MNDLPLFLHVFIRLFALLSLGAWLQTLMPAAAKPPSEHSRDDAAKIVVRPATNQAPAGQPPPTAGKD